MHSGPGLLPYIGVSPVPARLPLLNPPPLPAERYQRVQGELVVYVDPELWE